MAGKNRRSARVNKIICGKCKLEIKEEEESIECDKCTKQYHVLCTRLDKRQYEHLVKHPNEEYACHLCEEKSEESNGTLKNELKLITTELKKLDTLQETMNFMSKQYDDILKSVAENKKKLEIIQKENKSLKSEVMILKNSVKYLNDQRVKNDCLITGVKPNEGATALKTVLKLATDVGVTLQQESIDDAYFMKGRKASKGDVSSVVVKLNSTKCKTNLMSIKKKLSEKDETKNIFIHDFLSRETLSLLNYAKSLKTVGYRAVYAAGGKIFVKRSEQSKPRIVWKGEDVDAMLLEAATHNPKSRRSQRVDVVLEDSDDPYMSP